MHLSELYRYFESLPWIPHLETPSGTIYRLETPEVLFAEGEDGVTRTQEILLPEFTRRFEAGEEWFFEWDRVEEMPVVQTLEEAGHFLPLINTVEWGSMTCTDYGAGILGWGRPEAAYGLTLPDWGCGMEQHLFARLVPGDSRALLQAFVEDLVRTAGQPYHVHAFIPTTSPTLEFQTLNEHLYDAPRIQALFQQTWRP